MFQNVISTFNQIAKNKRFRFYGNVDVGQVIGIEELRKAYSAVVLVRVNFSQLGHTSSSIAMHKKLLGENLYICICMYWDVHMY